MERCLIIFRKGPYGQINSLEGIRVAQGFLVLDVETDAIFTDDGVAVKGLFHVQLRGQCWVGVE